MLNIITTSTHHRVLPASALKSWKGLGATLTPFSITSDPTPSNNITVLFPFSQAYSRKGLAAKALQD